MARAPPAPTARPWLIVKHAARQWLTAKHAARPWLIAKHAWTVVWLRLWPHAHATGASCLALLLPWAQEEVLAQHANENT